MVIECKQGRYGLTDSLSPETETGGKGEGRVSIRRANIMETKRVHHTVFKGFTPDWLGSRRSSRGEKEHREVRDPF